MYRLKRCATCSCRPAGDPSASKLGAFLVMSQFQGSVNSSAMFLTAAAQNLLCMKLATELGVVIPSPWLTWFKAAVLPAALGLLITPFLLYKASPLWVYGNCTCIESPRGIVLEAAHAASATNALCVIASAVPQPAGMHSRTRAPHISCL
jgi:Sodium:sulfate symporter transmembrane region